MTKPVVKVKRKAKHGGFGNTLLSRKGSSSEINPIEGNSPSTSTTKGLRLMSVKICEKVQKLGTTTCTAVAEELIQIIKKEQAKFQGDKRPCDEKNVRRRTYDALNVLEAVNVIAKDNKDVTWKGLPNGNNNEARRLVEERAKQNKRIQEKKQELREKLAQQVAYRNLVLLNKHRSGDPSHICDTDRIEMPFFVVSANTQATVHCDASHDMSHIMMAVNAPFAIHDENSILRQMGLDQTSIEHLREMFPHDMLEYCQQYDLLGAVLPTSFRVAVVSATKKRVRGSDTYARASKRARKTPYTLL